jgi:hypothetical protein
MDEIYSSTPLVPGSQSIRVLDLKPQKDQKRLLGTIRVVRISQSPKFTALSYVWGKDPSQTANITANGLQMSITQNCYNALTSICSQYGALTILVDSICINQQDDLEKVDQIQLMDGIYSWAQKVYVWLGNGNPRAYAAINCMRLVPVTFQWLRLIEMVSAQSNLRRLLLLWRALFRSFWYIFTQVRNRPQSELLRLLADTVD